MGLTTDKCKCHNWGLTHRRKENCVTKYNFKD